jgi:hypothetical protein
MDNQELKKLIEALESIAESLEYISNQLRKEIEEDD